jgi:VWFA-related protein
MPKARTSMAVCTLLLVLMAGTAASYAQSAQSTAQNDQEPIDTLKVSVNVVQLFFNVKDKKGGLIPNLTKDQFQVLEDGKPQTVKYFTAESNLPLTLGILIDTSPSQRQVLEMEKEVGGQFLDQVLREKDLAFVLGFDVDVDLLQDFTSSTKLLKKAMNNTRIGGGGSMSPGMGGGPVPTLSQACCTMLYDAVYLASHDELAQQVGRKAMILLTDGEDEGSKVKVQDAIEAAQKSDSICYVLLIADRGSWQGFGGGEMNKLAKETGGRVIDVGNKFQKLKEGFNQIANELRSQYNLGYVPTNDKQDGTFRKIQIQPNNKDYKIQARSGYYAVARRD